MSTKKQQVEEQMRAIEGWRQALEAEAKEVNQALGVALLAEPYDGKAAAALEAREGELKLLQRRAGLQIEELQRRLPLAEREDAEARLVEIVKEADETVEQASKAQAKFHEAVRALNQLTTDAFAPCFRLKELRAEASSWVAVAGVPVPDLPSHIPFPEGIDALVETTTRARAMALNYTVQPSDWERAEPGRQARAKQATQAA